MNRRLASGAPWVLGLTLTATACSSPSPPPLPVPGVSTRVVVATVDAGTPDRGRKTATSNDPPPNPKDMQLVAKTLATVSQIRGIRATREVPGVKLRREELVARVKEKALREYPPDALRREGQVLQLMGFAPAGFDYLGEMMKLLEAQLDGFYEPKNGTMYLAAELRGAEAHATLAHELVHALQDQQWDLNARTEHRAGRSDESLALAALAEGDATSVMLDFILRGQAKDSLQLSPQMMRSMMESGVGAGAGEDVPHLLRVTLIAPYVEGLAFVHDLRKKGGFPLVDKAWARPPVTTEQVLHVEKWESQEPAIAIAAPSAKALGAGWKTDDEDSFGELGFALTFGEWLDAADAREIAAGWGGDRSTVWTNGDKIALAVHLRYDAEAKKPDAFSERAFKKLAPALKQSVGKPALNDATTICIERKNLGPLLLSRRGRDLVMLAGPSTNAGGTWTASGTCAQAKAWAVEVLAQP